MMQISLQNRVIHDQKFKGIFKLVQIKNLYSGPKLKKQIKNGLNMNGQISLQILQSLILFLKQFKELGLQFKLFQKQQPSIHVTCCLLHKNNLMPYHKLTTKQWEQFSREISFSKDTVEEFSKLYIIIHEKVKSSIKNSVVNPRADFSSEINYHIQFIKNVLQKIKDIQNDQYLSQVERHILVKYEKNLVVLLQQIQLMLNVQQSKINLNVEALKGIKPQKREEYDLKTEIVKSARRITRAKSGYKIRSDQSKLNFNSIINKQKQENSIKKLEKSQPKLNPKTINLQIKNEEELKLAFDKKFEKLSTKIQNSMLKSSNKLGISFQKKYEDNYLEMYFSERKQFTDLIFNQQAYNKILSNAQFNHLEQSFHNSTNNFKLQTVNSKLFPQFQIKTKFLKPALKSKISNLITQIKKQLLTLYYADNIKTLKSTNEIQQSQFPSRKKNSLSTVNQRSYSNIQRSQQLQSIIKNLSPKKYSKADSSAFAKTDQLKSQKESQLRANLAKSLSELNKRHIFRQNGRSFINKVQKPFYETNKWNKQIEKKYEEKVQRKLVNAKI